MKTNKIKIHVEYGNLYFDNVHSNESNHDFFLAQLKRTKKLIPVECEISDNYKIYVLEYLDITKK